MKVLFKRPRIVEGKLYAKDGVPQILSEKCASHWFVQGLIKAGDIEVLDEEVKACEPKAEELAAAQPKKKPASQPQKKAVS